MARRKLTPEMERDLVDAYRAWDPMGAESASELAERFGVSRQVMYAVLARQGVPLKTRVGLLGEVPAMFTGEVLEAMAEQALTHLFRRVSELEREAAMVRACVKRYLAGEVPKSALRELVQAPPPPHRDQEIGRCGH